MTVRDLAASVLLLLAAATIVYNHLNQPRELVNAEVVSNLFA